MEAKRFISADTIVPKPFYPISLNRYAYAYNNPIILKDLDGHDPNDYWNSYYWDYSYNSYQNTYYNYYSYSYSNYSYNNYSYSSNYSSSSYNSYWDNSSWNSSYNSSSEGLGYVNYTSFENMNRVGTEIRGPYSIESKIYTGHTVGNEDNLFAVTTYPDSSPVYSLRIPYTAEVGISFSHGGSFSASLGEYSIEVSPFGGPSLSTSIRAGGSTNVSEYVTTYSLSPYVDHLRDNLSATFNTNHYYYIWPQQSLWYAFP